MATWYHLICVQSYKVVYLATMKLEEIQAKFAQVVHDKALMKKIEATKYQLYYWRHPEKQETKVGTMLEVLWKVDMLSFKDE